MNRLLLTGAILILFSCAKESNTAVPVTEPEAEIRTILVDQPLIVEFEKAPVLNAEGLIQVLREDGTVADCIDMAHMDLTDLLESGVRVPAEKITERVEKDGVVTPATKFNSFMDALHCTRYRIVHCTPVRVKGNTLEIRLHSDVLEFGKNYSLVIDGEVVTGFDGIRKGEYSFRTKEAPSSATSLKVAADGSGDFFTIQRALSFADKTGCEITVSDGTYEELLYLREKNNITIKGESRDGVKIVYPNNEGYCYGSGGNVSAKPSLGDDVAKSGGRCLMLVENCDNLTLENLTIENSFDAADHKGQAETVYFNDSNNTRKFVIENCTLLSWQDTFLTKGKVWVHNSLIAGHVDFIWGYPATCLFEDCEIRSRAAGYIVQARCPVGSKGFVFLNCNLTADSGVKAGSMYLARSGGDTSVQDNVTYVNCRMSTAIAPGGWFGPSEKSSAKKPTPEVPTATAGWKEYGSMDASGAALDLSSRNAHGKVLSADEAGPFLSREEVLGF